MDYIQLKEQTMQVSPVLQNDYKRLLQFSSIGGDVKPTLRAHLEAASALDEFYDMIYADDACRFENAWAYWAKMKGAEWPRRFEFEDARFGVRLQQRGLAIECNDLQFYIPMIGRNRTADIYLFADGKVNDAAAEYFTSVSGTFTLLDMAFAGTYDILVGPRLVVFERWEFDCLGNRLNGKGETKQCCSCR